MVIFDVYTNAAITVVNFSNMCADMDLTVHS